MIVRPIPSAGLSLASAAAAAQLAAAWDARRQTPEPDPHLAGWLLIRQPDHAALAGEFARHWGNDLFEPPAQRKEVTTAIAYHDDGWVEPDAVPRWSCSTCGPQSFLELEPEEFTSISRHSIHCARTRSPLAGFMVSWHFRELAQARAALDANFAALPEIQSFIAQQQELAAQWRPLFASFTDEAVAQACHLLQFSDMLSIYICLGALDDATFPQEFLTRAGSRVRLNLRFQPQATIVLSPYPFDRSPLRLRVSGRRLSRGTFTCQEELAQAYNKASGETLSVEIRAGT